MTPNGFKEISDRLPKIQAHWDVAGTNTPSFFERSERDHAILGAMALEDVPWLLAEVDRLRALVEPDTQRGEES